MTKTEIEYNIRLAVGKVKYYTLLTRYNFRQWESNTSHKLLYKISKNYKQAVDTVKDASSIINQYEKIVYTALNDKVHLNIANAQIEQLKKELTKSKRAYSKLLKSSNKP